MDEGYDITSVDTTPPPGLTNPLLPGQVRFSRADVTDFGQAMAALSMIDERVAKVTAVVHLRRSPPRPAPNHVIFGRTRSPPATSSSGARLGIRNVVWASSETIFGVPYPKGPKYVPVDEEVEWPEPPIRCRS